MQQRDYDIVAERFIGEVARHARHTRQITALDSAKEIARIITREVVMITHDIDWSEGVLSAIDRICPGQKAVDEFKNRNYDPF